MRARCGNLRVAWPPALAIALAVSFVLPACSFEPSIWVVSPQEAARVQSPVQLVLSADSAEIGALDSGRRAAGLNRLHGPAPTGRR